MSTERPGRVNDKATSRVHRPLTRRAFLRASVALGAAGAAGAALSPRHARLIEAALASDQSQTASLSDIEHIVILMQENRSFDHYFGTLSDVRGYSDPRALTQVVNGARYSIFDQFGPAGYSVGGDRYLQPFELVSNFPSENGQTTDDITHDWGPQHFAWNSGAMNQWMPAHLDTDGPKVGFLTMGYFTRNDLPFYHALADAFTICDGYHCSVLGPTDPNRLMWMSGSLGASGEEGGPVLETYTDPTPYYGKMDWLTMPESLTEAGVSWKVYQDPSSPVLFNVLPFFKNYANPSTSRDAQVAANGIGPQYPAEFVADVAAGTLPSVSWLIPPAECCEHPAAPPAYGEWLVSQILSTLVSNPDVWAKTVFLVVYDENGGWFDHVPPPTPGPLALTKNEIPASDDLVGEYITAPLPSSGTYTGGGNQLDVYGPVGLGFRTPCLVISPFSRGGYLCSETFDHISTLKLVSARFGVPVPNASKWRLNTVGDLTSALALTLPPNSSVPSLPATSIADPEVAAQAVADALMGTEDEELLLYPPPTRNYGIPKQESEPSRRSVPTNASTRQAATTPGGGAKSANSAAPAVAAGSNGSRPGPASTPTEKRRAGGDRTTASSGNGLGEPADSRTDSVAAAGAVGAAIALAAGGRRLIPRVGRAISGAKSEDEAS